MKESTVKKIINEVFPKIEKHYGFSKFQEYCSMLNEITIYEISIYYPQMKSRKMVIQTLIHEYIHYLQSPTWFKRYYNMGHDYVSHPYEKEAISYEKDYKLFI